MQPRSYYAADSLSRCTDNTERCGTAYLPYALALERKYPNANCEWWWQYVSGLAPLISRVLVYGGKRSYHQRGFTV